MVACKKLSIHLSQKDKFLSILIETVKFEL